MTTKRFVLIGLMLSLVLGVSSAAPAPQAGDPQSRARLRERISDLYLLRLTRALELTEEQTAKLYPVLTRVEKEKAALQRDMGLDLRDLRAELAKTPPGEKEVLGLVDRIRQARRAIRERDEEVEADPGPRPDPGPEGPIYRLHRRFPEECRGEPGAGPAGARDLLKEPLDKNLSSL